MFRTIWIASVHTHNLLRAWMPTNILLDAIRTRRGLKWGLPAMLLAIPYLYGASLVFSLIEAGAAGWLHLVVLMLIWNAMKFALMGPMSLILLARARAAEWRARANLRRPVGSLTHL